MSERPRIALAFLTGQSTPGRTALSPAQAVVMASMLPAPLRVDVARPTTWLRQRSRRLLDRMHAAGRLSDAAHRSASAELERILAGPAPADDRDEPPEEEAPTAPLPPAELAVPPAAPSPQPAAEATASGAG